MPLMNGKCKYCGGNFKLNPETRSGKCPYCDAEYLAEEVIQNYNYYITNKYEIKNAQINIEDSQSVEKRLASAEVYLTKIHDYGLAEKIFYDVSKIAPSNYKCWWGLVRAKTGNLTDFTIGDARLNSIIGYEYKNALAFASPDVSAGINDEWFRYLNSYNGLKERVLENKRRTENEKNQIIAQNESLNADINLCEGNLSRSRKSAENFETLRKLSTASMIIGLIIAVGLYIASFTVTRYQGSGALRFWAIALVVILVPLPIFINVICGKRKAEISRLETQITNDKQIIEENMKAIGEADKAIAYFDSQIIDGIKDQV